MAVFIETRTDPFSERRQQIANDVRESGRNQTPVRRPVRGIEIKEDTYAVIRVALATGDFLPVLDAAGDIVTTQDGRGYTTQYTNFLIQTVVEERSEKQQVVETFGDAYIFFYGEAPRMLVVQGLLLNTADFNWRAEWWDNYERYFRGTRLVEYGARLYLIYDDIIVEGYMMSAQAQENSQQPYVIPVTFQIFVTGYTNVSAIGNPNFPRPSGDIDYSLPQSYVDSLVQLENDRNLQREVSTDAVRRANIAAYEKEAYLGSGRLLTSAIRQGLMGGDPSINGFLQRSYGAIAGMRSSAPYSTAPNQAGWKANPFEPAGGSTLPAGFKANPFDESGRILRSTFRDNTDEFLGNDTPSARDLASPLSMAERWLAMDRAMDSAVASYIDPTDARFYDLMGRAGRAVVEVNRRQGLRARSDGVLFQSGAMRHMSPGTVRTVPFGMGAFAEI